MTVTPTVVGAAAHSRQYYQRQRLLRQFIGPSRGVDGLLFAVNSMLSSERGEKKVNLKEALEEIREEYQNDAVVITSEHDRVLDDFIDGSDGGQEVWLEWGEVSSGDVTVPATHIFFLDEDGFTRHDGSVLSVVSARDYELLGR